MNLTLYSPKYNIEYYNIHKTGQTSILRSMDHPDKKCTDRIEWYPVSELPENRKIVCVLRDVYSRAISSYLHLLQNPGLQSIKKLPVMEYKNIYENPKGVIEGFRKYLEYIDKNGPYDDHSVSQYDFITPKIKEYGSYLMSSDRDPNKVTNFISFETMKNDFFNLFGIVVPHINEGRKPREKKILQNNMNLYKNLIEKIYTKDIELIRQKLCRHL